MSSRNALVFLIALVTGTGCSILSKALFMLHGTDEDGNEVLFEKPLFQTAAMFVAMILAGPVHFAWAHAYPTAAGTGGLSRRMALMLFLPALSDMMATVLAYVGLLYINASAFQLLKAGIIIFVAFERRFILHAHLHSFQWVGVLVNCVAIGMVGYASAGDEDASATATPAQAAWGVFMVLLSCFVQSAQYVLEEHFMEGDGEEGADSAPPLLVVALEGLWGLLLCLVVVYPLAGLVPGDDHGVYETLGGSWTLLRSNPDIQYGVLLYMFCILGFNSFAVLVTFLMDSLWHSILDQFRPVTVWAAQLFIFYAVSGGALGEALTRWAPLQFAGMLLLFAGTAIYNGNLKLPGFAYPPPEEVEAAAGMMSPVLSPLRVAGSSPGAGPAAAVKHRRMRAASEDAGADAYGTFQGHEAASAAL